MMTFEEFKQLAVNPPTKDEPTIFRIKTYSIDIASIQQRLEEKKSWSEDKDSNTDLGLVYYPSFPVKRQSEHYSQTLADAEQIMKRVAQIYAGFGLYCFCVDELPFKEDTSFQGYVSRRIYNDKAELVEQSRCSSIGYADRLPYMHYRGRTPEMIRFKAGDIVEVFSDGQVSLAMVVDIPPTVEESYQIALNGYEDDIIDVPHGDQLLEDNCIYNDHIYGAEKDCYTVKGVVDFEEPYQVSSMSIFKPRFPIPAPIEIVFMVYKNQLFEDDSK